MQDIHSYFRIVRQHFDELRKNFKVEKTLLAERIVLSEFTDELGSFTSNMSVFRVEAGKNYARATDFEEILKKFV